MGRLDDAVDQALRARSEQSVAGSTPAAKEAVGKPQNGVADPAMRGQPQAPVLERMPPSVITREVDMAAHETFAQLRGRVFRAVAASPMKRSILVTSPSAGEGKSMVALNLAASIAQSFDHTALLIDADLRRPSLHKLLEVTPQAGLLQYLRGEAGFDKVAVRTGIGKLDFIPAGGSVDNPVELLSSAKTRAALDEIFSRYPDRFVIIDSPPLLPFAETNTLAHAAGGVILVVRQGVTEGDAIQKSLDLLKDTNLLGMLLNGGDAKGKISSMGSYGYGDVRGAA